MQPAIKHKLYLADLLTAKQDQALAQMLLDVIHNGFGTIEIEVIEGKVRFFKPKPSINVEEMN